MEEKQFISSLFSTQQRCSAVAHHQYEVLSAHRGALPVEKPFKARITIAAIETNQTGGWKNVVHVVLTDGRNEWPELHKKDAYSVLFSHSHGIHTLPKKHISNNCYKKTTAGVTTQLSSCTACSRCLGRAYRRCYTLDMLANKLSGHGIAWFGDIKTHPA